MSGKGADAESNQVWVDADACPVVIKDILFRAAQRTGVQLTLVANQPMRVPGAPNITLLTVASGLDVADSEIVRRLTPGDLVITSDIPLAAEVIEKGGHALSHRGELYSPDTIGQLLNMRDFMDTLRGSGINTGGPPTLSKSDRKSFADHLDRLLTKFTRDA
ncbi:MAG: YaiI/YqxD family protein [Gemmatimonadetes bacterium]|nr:YaiI/YqxD family protein [Gemmatimonadota bacterium]